MSHYPITVPKSPEDTQRANEKNRRRRERHDAKHQERLAEIRRATEEGSRFSFRSSVLGSAAPQRQPPAPTQAQSGWARAFAKVNPSKRVRQSQQEIT